MEYMKVSKIDYYSWVVGSILLIFLIVAILIFNKPSAGELNDNYYHIGYTDCEMNYNFSTTEMELVNTYRIYHANNQTIYIGTLNKSIEFRTIS